MISAPRRSLQLALASLFATVLVALTLSPATAQVDKLENEIQILSTSTDDQGLVELIVAIPPSMGEVQPDSSSFALLQGSSRRGIIVNELRDEVDVVLVVDTSGSMQGAPLAAAKDAATEFVNQMPEGTRVAVIGFGAAPTLTSELTTDRDASRRAIFGLQARGETALWDAFVSAGELIENEGRTAPYVLMLSDGGDTASNATVDDAVQTISASGENVGVYVVTLETAESDHTALIDAASRLSGQVLTTNDAGTLEALYSEIAGRLNSRYSVRFRPTEAQNLVLSVAVEGSIATARTTLSSVQGVQVSAPNSVEGSTLPETLNGFGDPELGVVIAATPSLLGSSSGLWIGALAMFGGLVMLFGFLAIPAMSVQPLQAARSMDAANRVGVINERMSGAADRLIKRRDSSGALDKTLDAAGLDIRAGEFVVMLLVAVVSIGAVGSVIFGNVAAIALIFLTAIGGWFVVSFKAVRRRRAFSDQLSNTITIMTGSLRAGRGLPQAMEMVAQEAAAPTCEEFRRVIIETRVGRDPVAALNAVANRMESTDLEWINQAIAINRELGGDLVELLSNVDRTVRDRNRLKLQVRALSAEGRASGWVIFALPLFMYAYLRAVNPDYINLLHTTSGGIKASIVGVIALVVGGFWIRNMVNIKF